MITHQSKQARCSLSLYVVEQGSQINREDKGDGIVVELGKEINFNPNVLDSYNYDGWRPLHYDLMVVCAAVEFADRRRSRGVTQWSRSFNLTVPVQELVVWQQAEVKESLSNTLRHLTGDTWNFSFVRAEKMGVNEARQHSLPFGSIKQFVLAYSEGLDSRCVSGILDKSNNAVRLRLSRNRERLKKGEHPFDLIPFEVKGTGSRESSVRSRGFKFAAMTAIAGHISDVNKIVVPESGQGALGPVLLPLHNTYADYRNHPTFFRKMECFIETLLNYKVVYKQPRLWYTKGQTISLFLEQTGASQKSLHNTRSCWQQKWNVRQGGKLRQCGLCAACLLRRMSMHAARIEEPSDTYTFADLTESRFEAAMPKNSRSCQGDMMVQYGSVGVRHLQQLADLARRPDTELRRHAFEIARATGESEQVTRDNLRTLLVQHAKEWRDFVSAQGEKSFIKNWTEGGRYGRS